MKTYTSKERVLAALNHQEADRVPIDFGGINNSTIHYKIQNMLLEHLGYEPVGTGVIKSHSQQVVIIDERILKHFESDTRSIYLDESHAWIQPKKGEYIDHFGLGYVDDDNLNFRSHFSSPLINATTVEEILEYKMPNPRAQRIVAGLKEQCETYKDKALVLDGLRGGAFELVSWIRGITTFYMDLLIDKELAKVMIDKVVEYEMELVSFAHEELGDAIDIIKCADDLGTQISTIISEELYVELIKPAQARLYSHIKKTFKKAKLLLHCCGSIRPFIPHFIEIGVDAINPVQISAVNMDPQKLKDDFGDRLTFWGGGIDTQVTLPMGTPKEVATEVKRNIEIFKPGGGYVFATVHNITPGVPLENILALFESYKKNCIY